MKDAASWILIEECYFYLNGDGSLLILIGGENLRLLCWDHSVPGNQFGHHSTDGLDPKGKRSNIQQENICIKITLQRTRKLELSAAEFQF